MPDPRPRSPARLLAPAALVLAVVAVVIVLGASRANDDSGGNGEPASDTGPSTSAKTTRTTAARKKTPKTYTVKTGDSLGSIAGKAGLTIEKLQELNPDVDPQALVAGQKIKLVE